MDHQAAGSVAQLPNVAPLHTFICIFHMQMPKPHSATMEQNHFVVLRCSLSQDTQALCKHFLSHWKVNSYPQSTDRETEAHRVI